MSPDNAALTPTSRLATLFRMIPQWIIEKKRDGHALSPEEISFFIEGYTRDDIPDYQMSALAMAIYFQGMTMDETAHLTECMMRSGDVVDTSSITLPKVDKHSTGGVGDKVSMILAPMMACCGVAVPMISGRGLGITGGTLDKLESIPGYRVDITEKEFLDILHDCGCSIIGQTSRLAPADKKLYALRDVTATVPSIPLITASIMSKKLAEGIDALVMDVKWGKGAFMKTYEDAQALARSIVEVGTRMGKGMAGLITDMNQPLGAAAGNALEIMESAETLKGEGPDDLMEVTMSLCAQMLIIVDIAKDHVDALKILNKHIASGAAFEKFQRMIKLHGGDPASVEDYAKLPTARLRKTVTSPHTGYVTAVSAECIGRAVIMLGGGRAKTDDRVDHAVGVSDIVKVGAYVEEGEPLFTLHGNQENKMDEALKLAADAVIIGEEHLVPPPLIKDVILPRRMK